MSGRIERFSFEVEPWRFGNGASELRVNVVVDGQRHSYSVVAKEIPFNKSELEIYLREALAAFAKAGEGEPGE